MKHLLFTILIITGCTFFTFSQQSIPNTIKANFTEKKIILDGTLDEAAWANAQTISNFTQRELDFGQPVSEKTKVAVIYTKNALYFGVWCYQNPKSIVAKNMGVDFDVE